MNVRDVNVVGDQLAAVPCAGDRGRVLVEQIDLLEGKTLRLGNAEVCEHETARARRAPDKEDLDAEVGVTRVAVDEVRRCERDSPVPEPVEDMSVYCNIATGSAIC